MHRTRISLPALLAALAANAAGAQEQRTLDAHEHGVSKVEIAIAGDVVEVAFHAPGFDIVGFEHAASSDEDKAAVEAAVETLERADMVVELDAAAGCRVVETSAGLHLEDAHDAHGEMDHHDEGEAHDADAHAEDHDHDDGDHEDHDDHEAGKATHSEFEAQYRFQCGTPSALSTIRFPFFETFPNAAEIEAVFVTDGGAGGAEIRREDPVLELK